MGRDQGYHQTPANIQDSPPPPPTRNYPALNGNGAEVRNLALQQLCHSLVCRNSVGSKL